MNLIQIKKFVPEYSATIPFSQGAAEIMDWIDEDPSRQVVDETLDKQMDQIIETYGSKLGN